MNLNRLREGYPVSYRGTNYTVDMVTRFAAKSALVCITKPGDTSVGTWVNAEDLNHRVRDFDDDVYTVWSSVEWHYPSGDVYHTTSRAYSTAFDSYDEAEDFVMTYAADHHDGGRETLTIVRMSPVPAPF